MKLGTQLITAAWAAAIAFGGVALANPATACAERVWDIGEYDSCSRNVPADQGSDPDKYLEHLRWCCFKSGGDWNTGTRNCQAPAEGPVAPNPGPISDNTGQVDDPVKPAPPKPRPTLAPGGVLAP